MLKSIDSFRTTGTPLQVLVGELEFHLQALIMNDHHWQSAFFERWRQLDRYQSSQLARGGDNSDPEVMQRIEAAIEDLRQMISGILSGMDTR